MTTLGLHDSNTNIASNISPYPSRDQDRQQQPGIRYTHLSIRQQRPYHTINSTTTPTTTTMSVNGTAPDPQQAATEAQQLRVDSILTDLDASLSAGGGNGEHPPSPHSVADAQRAMSHTASWTPAFDRRQSWSKEEHKHAQHMSGLDEVKTGPGFSERS